MVSIIVSTIARRAFSPFLTLSAVTVRRHCYSSPILKSRILSAEAEDGLKDRNEREPQSTLTSSMERLASERSFYMRPLPETCISLYSEEGTRLLHEATVKGMAKGFLQTLGCLEPQSELTYCGPASLVTVLNSLRVDPGKIWKGSFRWYAPEMLADEEVLNDIKVDGIIFEKFIQLIPEDKVKVESFSASESSFHEFKQAVVEMCSSSECLLITSYSRQVLRQSGDGHYSPIGAYHDETDSILVLDVARYKYSPHWVSCSLLWAAMKGIDKESGKTRGYIKISKLGVDGDK